MDINAVKILIIEELSRVVADVDNLDKQTNPAWGNDVVARAKNRLAMMKPHYDSLIRIATAVQCPGITAFQRNFNKW